MNETNQSNAQPTDDPLVKQTIQMLWSQESRVRELGRKEILRIGSAAIEPLIRLLSDLIKNQYPRFAAGKEEEGHKVLEDYVDLIPFLEDLTKTEKDQSLLYDILTTIKRIKNESSTSTAPQASRKPLM